MADGTAALNEQIRRLRSLEGMVERAAPGIARAVRDDITSHVASGEAPDGAKWKPKADGSAPLKNAASAVRAEARGTVIVTSVEGHHALHHLGRARGGVRRQIIPTRGIPDPMVRAIGAALSTEFSATTRGDR